ncbi:hypothetical protein Tco_1311578 [Tanacetum coccineum]
MTHSTRFRACSTLLPSVPKVMIRIAAIESFLNFLYERYRSEQSFLYKIAKFRRPSFIGLYKHFEHHHDDGIDSKHAWQVMLGSICEDLSSPIHPDL